MNDEKEARTYLEGLAGRLNHELEEIRNSGAQTLVGLPPRLLTRGRIAC